MNYTDGSIYIKGKSSPENTPEFYNPVFKAISDFQFADRKDITANLQYVYFNTSSARCIYMILTKLKKLQDLGKNVTVNWYAEEDDEDMIETGMDFQDIVDIHLNIELIEVSNAY